MSSTGPQEKQWEGEYRERRMLSPSNSPHADVVRFLKWLKKEAKKEGAPLDLDGMAVLDLGSGTGRNSFYFADRGAHATGYEISDTALTFARGFASEAGLAIEYRKQDIGAPYPAADASVDIALDVTSSNSLDEKGRAVHLSELMRVMKPGAYLFVRALSKEADVHAKALVAKFPGPEPDTYVHPDLHLTEKVFTRDSFIETYKQFDVLKLERTEHYATVSGRKYKRHYWIAYLRKPSE